MMRHESDKFTYDETFYSDELATHMTRLFKSDALAAYMMKLFKSDDLATHV